MSKTVEYRGYTIESLPKRLVDTGKWKLNIRVSWEQRGWTTSRNFAAESFHETEDEADTHGISYGQRIVDGKVPGLPVG